MSPETSILIDTSIPNAAPDAHQADVAPSLHGSSSHGTSVQEPKLRSASQPPPYSRNTPLDDPFRDGDAIFLKKDGMQGVPTPATAIHVDPPREPSAHTNPFISEVVIDESLRPPLPPRPAGLRRGLQIPSRVSHITWGFGFPTILAEQGVTKAQWRLFKHELESFARMTWSQSFEVMGYHIMVHHFVGPIPGQ